MRILPDRDPCFELSVVSFQLSAAQLAFLDRITVAQEFLDQRTIGLFDNGFLVVRFQFSVADRFRLAGKGEMR